MKERFLSEQVKSHLFVPVEGNPDVHFITASGDAGDIVYFYTHEGRGQARWVTFEIWRAFFRTVLPGFYTLSKIAKKGKVGPTYFVSQK